MALILISPTVLLESNWDEQLQNADQLSASKILGLPTKQVRFVHKSYLN